MGTLWEGRLSGATTDALKALNDSLEIDKRLYSCLLYTSPSPRDGLLSRMPSSA